MKITTTYRTRIYHDNDIFMDTIRIYRAAVDFFVKVCLTEWDTISPINGIISRQTFVQGITIVTKSHPTVKYDFGRDFYKFPCYLRRAAINEAIGKVSSYMSNLANWKASDPGKRGKCPSLPVAGYVFPVLYKGNMYKSLGSYHADIKVYRNNTWGWLTVRLRKSDVAYIQRHCSDRTMLSPTLMKRGKVWSLDFVFEEERTLIDTPVMGQTIIAVDLGINNVCVCSAMTSDGTVAGRHSLKLPAENDSLMHALGRIKKAQQHGAERMPRLWARAKGINNDIAVKTARFIMDTATLYKADVIAFEHFDIGGKKRGPKKQRLHMWKARYVQSMVTDKAHRMGMHVSHVNAWNTSRLAFDGSGRVLRGRESVKTHDNYSLCEFPTGKVYNCDLNASYNIGARYFIREILKSVTETQRLRLEAKVPQVRKRSTCTLSTLISLNAELMPFAA